MNTFSDYTEPLIITNPYRGLKEMSLDLKHLVFWKGKLPKSNKRNQRRNK